MKWPDLLNLDGYLPENLEKSYRRYYLKEDIRIASVSMCLLCIILIAFAYNDYVLFGLTSIFYFLIFLRMIFLIYFLALLIFFRAKLTPNQYDWNLFSWLITGIMLVAAINLTRPASYIGNVPIDAIMIILIYLAMPIRLSLRFSAGLLFTIADIFIFFIIRKPVSITVAYASIISLLLANIVGIYASSRIHSSRRREFQTNITNRREAKIWQSTFNSITDLLSIHDSDYRIIRVNKAFADTFNVKPEEVIGKHCYEIVHNTASPFEMCPHAETLHKGTGHVEELYEPHLNSFFEISCSPTFDRTGNINGSVHIMKNINERKQTVEKLQLMAMHDSLTKLPNRVLLVDRFNIALAKARRDKKKLAIMMLDLDKFKLINDSFGHQTGDDLLKAVVSRLTDLMRKNDTIARLGGDEFVILLTDVNTLSEVSLVAEKILDSFNEPFSINDNQICITTSIGATICPDDSADIESLLTNADAAMYYAKEHGRNRFQLFHPVQQ